MKTRVIGIVFTLLLVCAMGYAQISGVAGPNLNNGGGGSGGGGTSAATSSPFAVNGSAVPGTASPGSYLVVKAGGTPVWTATPAAASTQVVMDVNVRAVVRSNACANSGTSAVTCSNAVAGDLLLVYAGDCTGTSTQTCPSGFAQVITSGTGGTQVTVCSKTAVGGDEAVSQKITSSAHQLTTACMDLYSTGGSTLTVQTTNARSGLQNNYILSTIATNFQVDFIGSQTAVPTPPVAGGFWGYNYDVGGATALESLYGPTTSGSFNVLWGANSSSLQTEITLLISG